MLHESFEVVAFILLRERNEAVFLQDLVESHGRRTCCFGGDGDVWREMMTKGYRNSNRFAVVIEG